MHNYFEILKLEESFEIDENLLEDRYFEELAKYHPDKASEDKKPEFAAKSSIINNAYEVLKNDFHRAAHILEIHGININSDATAPKLPIDILEGIMEMQESLEDPTKKEAILEKAIILKQEILLELKMLFAEKKYNNAAIKAMELKYLERLLSL